MPKSTPKPKTKTKAKLPSPPAIMNIEKGEEIFGGWVTPPIPEVGIYKLLAKKKADQTVEWAHFVQRDDGQKERLYRGTVEDANRLLDVIQAINNSLHKAYGAEISLHPAEADVYSLTGQKASKTIH